MAREGYRSLLNAHALPFFGNCKIETIAAADVRRGYNLMKVRPIKPIAFPR
jgi:hypothetical protein